MLWKQPAQPWIGIRLDCGAYWVWRRLALSGTLLSRRSLTAPASACRTAGLAVLSFEGVVSGLDGSKGSLNSPAVKPGARRNHWMNSQAPGSSRLPVWP